MISLPPRCCRHRNFEGRVSQGRRANYLASPPLVVRLCAEGTVREDMYETPKSARARNGEDVFLKEYLADQR